MRGKKSETLDRVDNRVQQIDGEGHKGKRVPFCIARHPIANNIAEGNGKRSLPDRCRYLDIARGSALECAACLDGLVARRKLSADHA